MISFLPQAIEVWKLRPTHDISAGMLTLLAAAVGLWIVYGEVIVANMVTLLFAPIVLDLKLGYRRSFAFLNVFGSEGYSFPR